MEKYEAVQDFVERARIERSVYVAEQLTDAIVTAWNGVNKGLDALRGAAAARIRHNVFTFDI
jgi:hypothetical protein